MSERGERGHRVQMWQDGGETHLVDEAVLLSGLHGAGPVLPERAHGAEDVHLGLALEEALQANISGQQHSSPANARRAVHHHWPLAVSHLDLPERERESVCVCVCACCVLHSLSPSPHAA